MAEALDVAIGTKHGPDCACRPLEPLALTIAPVIVNRDCPGQRELARDERIDGRVIITWAPGGFIAPGFAVTVTDADTGEPWTADVLNLQVRVDPRGRTTATLERMVDAGGAPIGRGKLVPTRDGKGYRTALFRYAVAEMRIAEAK